MKFAQLVHTCDYMITAPLGFTVCW